MKRKELEIKLQRIPPIPNPTAHLEQYSTPAGIAADILYFAFINGDIADKTVVDLGCGTGIFAIGAKLLGAKQVWGFETSDEAVQIARNMAKEFDLAITFEQREISDLGPGDVIVDPGVLDDHNAPIDTVIQNPPFGAQSAHADRIFLKTALALATVTYSLHLSRTREFIHSYINNLNALVTHEENYLFPIKHTFAFHSLSTKTVAVTLFRILRKPFNP